jgi:hypothetical protein
MVGGLECRYWDRQSTVLGGCLPSWFLLLVTTLIDKGSMLSFIDSHMLVVLLEDTLHL